MNSTSLEKLRTLSLVSATLEIEYGTQFQGINMQHSALFANYPIFPLPKGASFNLGVVLELLRTPWSEWPRQFFAVSLNEKGKC